MTTSDWFAAVDPDVLLQAFVQTADIPNRAHAGRLVACACVRQVWHLLSTDARSAVQVSERLAEGTATEVDMRAAAILVPRVVVTPAQIATAAAAWASYALDGYEPTPGWEPPRFSSRDAARFAARALTAERIGGAPPGHTRAIRRWHEAWNRAFDEFRALQAAFVRDIIPPPGYAKEFEFNREWLTSTVVALARQMHESGDFSATPILADALQDVGCDDEAALHCCRVPGNVHVRGNWVVDLVLRRV